MAIRSWTFMNEFMMQFQISRNIISKRGNELKLKKTANFKCAC